MSDLEEESIDDIVKNPNQEIEVQTEEASPDDLPEEVEDFAKRKSGIDKNKLYKLDEEEAENLFKAISDNEKEIAANSEIKTGMAPQWWLVGLNNAAFALVAFVPGVNVVFGAVLYANLKILTMHPKKELENNFHEQSKNNPKSEEVKNPGNFGTKKNQESEEVKNPGNFGTKKNQESEEVKNPQNYGTKNNPKPEAIENPGNFGTKKNQESEEVKNPGNFGTKKNSGNIGTHTTKKVSFGTAPVVKNLQGLIVYPGDHQQEKNPLNTSHQETEIKRNNRTSLEEKTIGI